MENTKDVKPMLRSGYKKALIIGMAVIVVPIVLGLIISTFSSDQPRGDVAVNSAKSSEKVLENAIPGLSPVDVYLSLEQKGFAVNRSGGGKNGMLWTCKSKDYGIDYEVAIFSHSTDDVETVNASVMVDVTKKQIKAARQFLSYIASLPYANANPQKAKAWVEQNFDKDKAGVVIGGVKFTIFAPSKMARMLLVEKV